MPVYVLSEGTGPGTQVPAHLIHIPIPQITSRMDYTNKSVKGKVISKGPLMSIAADDFILKIVVQEDSEPSVSSLSTSINLVLFGALAKNFSETVTHGDVLVASGFTVAESSTLQEDKLHPCTLRLSGHDACLYVSRQLPASDPKSLLSNKRSTTVLGEVSQKSKTPKYTYVRLGDLKDKTVVNVYGVVVFFKQPFKSRGTDYCSSLKIIDQSNQKVGCTIFCGDLEDHPKIFQNGDIIRMHRVKSQSFNNSMTLLNTYGFSAVTFDGALGSAVEPRTSSKVFHFDQEDCRIVEELRSWASSQTLLPSVPTIPLSAVQPKMYFDLTCQLLAKAPIDTTCTLLRVWDGSRCPRTLLKVIVEPSSIEGSSYSSKEKEDLIANVLVYDNHVESARQLKPGAFLRIYNLHAIPGSSKVPGLTSCQPVEVDHLAFHLHGGTAYGRGIRVLPENSPDVQELKRTFEMLKEPSEETFNDSEMLEVWGTPPESLDVGRVESFTACERSCSHDVQPVTLSQLKRTNPGGIYHVRGQLRSYEPRRLHQALKLYCSKCTSILDVPDDELVAGVFSEACRDSGAFTFSPWLLSGHFDLPGDSESSPNRDLSIHLSTQLLGVGKSKDIIFLMGSTLEELRLLTAAYPNIIPVRSTGGRVTLVDLSAPFLFRGRKRFYGCKQCSEPKIGELPAEDLGALDEKVIAEALGVQLLQFVLLMKLQLQDATESLDVLLWRDAELFFGVSAEDAAYNPEAQTQIQQTMDGLCPLESSTGGRPWLNLCLTSYCGEDDNGQKQTCHQIVHSIATGPATAHSEPDPA